MATTAEDKSFDTYVYQVLKQVHPDTGMTASAKYIMDRICKIVIEKLMTAVNKLNRELQTKTVSSRDVQSAVILVFPGELAKHAVSEGTKAVTRYNSSNSARAAGDKAQKQAFRAGLIFSVSRVKNLMRLHSVVSRIGAGAPVYMAAVVEYIVAEILELAGNAARDYKKMRIKPIFISKAIEADEELSKFFHNVQLSNDARSKGYWAPSKQPKSKKGGKKAAK